MIKASGSYTRIYTIFDFPHLITMSSKVPREDRLVWNVKDGWKPLCEFLNCSVPPIPIPHDNRTGDTKYVEEFVFKSDFMKRSLIKMKIYIVGPQPPLQWTHSY